MPVVGNRRGSVLEVAALDADTASFLDAPIDAELVAYFERLVPAAEGL